jgi:hypothetical protein|tara:strand:+ start:488 stop:1561 length:1074 start_codon:yes stop_codon:yes gene_type:complete
MNSEEIKEIGQMFLMISKQNNESPGLNADEKDFIEECRDMMAESREMVTNAIPRLNKLEEELKDLKNNPHLAGFEHIKNRLGTAIEASRKFREEVRDKLHKLDIKETPTVELPPTFLKDKIGELGAKVGGYGGLISSLQRKDGERTEELNKIRKDYRELQDEMWERFKLVEAWIETKDSADKERIRLEILENGHTDKSEQAKQKLSSSLDTVENTPDATCVEPKKNTDSEIRTLAHKVLHRKAEETKGKLTKKDWLNWETSTSFAWSKIPISKLNNVSVRAHNALIVGGYQYIGSLLTQSPYDLIQVPNFGRKCLREVMTALEEKNLALNMQKFNEQKEERNSKNNTQRGNLYGFKS